jgi:hypothetical protein
MHARGAQRVGVVRSRHLATAHRTGTGAGARARPAKAPELGAVGLSLLVSLDSSTDQSPCARGSGAASLSIDSFTPTPHVRVWPI